MLILLTDPAADDLSLTGGKGSALARLLGQGLPVPPGFVVTTRALEDFLGRPDLQSRVEFLGRIGEGASLDDIREISDELRRAIIESTLPDELAKEVRILLEQLDPEARWAVRSSAVAEDLETASFAGQYDTVLGLRGPVEVGQAVLTCWASFFNAHAVKYQLERGISDFRGAVVVQKLIDADAAGVCFTLDPVSGKTDRLIINANFGLGESVVSGRVTPDTFVVAKEVPRLLERRLAAKTMKIVPAPGGSREEAIPESEAEAPSLTDEEALRVAGLARRIEERAGGPVDVEWALAQGEVYLLQSRPITAVARSGPPEDWEPELNTPIDPGRPLYSNGNISEVLPGCITPLSWCYIAPTIEGAFRNQLMELGAVAPGGPEYQVLGFFFHRPYICVSFMEQAAARTPGMTPDTIHEEFVGPVTKTSPPINFMDLLPHRWPAIYRVAATFARKTRSMDDDARAGEQKTRQEQADSSPDQLKQWTDEQLIEAVRFTPAMSKLSDVHIWASSFAVVYFDLLRKLTARWLGDQASAASMVTGIGALPSADPAFGLHRLAAMVKASPELGESFAATTDNGQLLSRLRADERFREFREALDDFLVDFGHRAVCEAEFRNPCWREDPAQVIGLIRNFLAAALVPPEEIKKRQDRIRTEAALPIQKLIWPKRALLNKVLGAARKNIERRERLKDLVVLRSDRARRVYGELQSRLLARDLLDDPDDLYFLVWSEVRDLVGGKLDREAARRIIARRRQDFAWSEDLLLPRIIDGKARPITEPEGEDEARLTGMGVSPGRVEGTARVILDPRRDSTIEPGEILVAPVTDAGWTPLFIAASGLVVEVGGLLSHGSVVAREYGLPAVVGVAHATRRIKTGDRLRLDGAAGTVVILDPC